MRSSYKVLFVAALSASIAAACGDSDDGTPPIGEAEDSGSTADAAPKADATVGDSAASDTGSTDVSASDAGIDSAVDDAADGSTDATATDATDEAATDSGGPDGSSAEGGLDAGTDAADAADTGLNIDAGLDAGGCSTLVLQGLTAGTISVSNGRDWTNPTSAITSNNAYAVVSSMVDGEISDYLTVTDFVSAVPLTSTVTGVSVTIERRQSGSTVFIADNLVRLVVGGAVVGQNKASGLLWTATDTTITYGGPTDLWGTTLTPADVNASTFGAAISVAYASTAGNSDARIDAIKVQVHYTCP